MKLLEKIPPREFSTGLNNTIGIFDCGEIYLDQNEQISFVTEQGARLDVCRKDWGYYVTPSINRRLKREGFKTALMSNNQGDLYIIVVEKCHLSRYERYCVQQNQRLLLWLDECDGRLENGWISA